MGNKRVFYACQGLALDGEPLRGVQNVSVRTDNNNHVVDEWGSHKIHNHYVDTPKSTISLSRIMTFGDHPIVTGSITGSGNSIATNHGRKLCLYFVSDTAESGVDSTAESPNYVFFRNVSVNSISYGMTTDGYLTEDVEFISYYKTYNSGECDISDMDILKKNVQEEDNYDGRPIKRENILSVTGGGDLIQSFNVNIPFNIQTVDEFGTAFSRDVKKYRYATYPIATSYSVTEIYQSGGFDTIEFGQQKINCNDIDLPKKSVQTIVTCSGTGFYLELGNCNLESMEYGGGDTSGGNANMTYNYTCYNSGLLLAASGLE